MPSSGGVCSPVSSGGVCSPVSSGGVCPLVEVCVHLSLVEVYDVYIYSLYHNYLYFINFSIIVNPTVYLVCVY